MILGLIKAMGFGSYLNVAMGAALLVAATVGYGYVRHTTGRIEQLTRDNVVLKVRVSEYELAVKELQSNFDAFRSTLEELYVAMSEAGIPEQRIAEFLASLNISEMTPEDLEAIIRAHQVDTNRCFEIVSGSNGPAKEKNSVCP